MQEEEKIKCRLTCGGGEEASTDDFYYRKIWRETGERDELWEGRMKLDRK